MRLWYAQLDSPPVKLGMSTNGEKMSGQNFYNLTRWIPTASCGKLALGGSNAELHENGTYQSWN